MKPERKNKFGHLIYIIVLLFLSVFVFGIGLVWALQTMGVSPAISGTLSSQMSIIIYGLALFNFNKDVIIDRLKNKLTFEAFWNGIKLTIIVLIINTIISTLFIQSSEIPEQTQSIVERNSFLMTFLFPVIVAPVAEELAFRAGLKYVLVDKADWKPWTYIILSSVIFGLLHWSPGIMGFAHVLLTGLMGTTYSIVYLKTNNIYTPIISHMLYNGLVITVASLV